MLMGVEPKLIREAVLQFKGLPHRLQLVGSIDGVDFFNDSKATNLDSACKSIMAFSRPIILIAGGRHKGASYKPLAEVSKGRVKFAIFIGESRHMIAKEFDGFIPFVFAETMDDAIRRAFSMAQTGDVVLLAPACSSFDMFRDYEHRGEVFESLVRKLSYEKSQTKVPGL
jgi:UDP-N-acetylmuramoylalanine--D-glutamate ligase